MDDLSIKDDIELVKELLGITTDELAAMADVDASTIYRWMSGRSSPALSNLTSFYDSAFDRGLRINEIKAQLHQELLGNQGVITLFHGAKRNIEGNLSLEHSRSNNDFGKGFYCGESLRQSAMFVSGFPNASLYVIGFDPKGLDSAIYKVDQNWMLTVAWYRGRLEEYAGHDRIRELVERAESADYIIAPIADNRMYEIMDRFLDGEITDVQCQHCLSATNLGDQYVFKKERALRQATLEEHCFLTPAEKRFYTQIQASEADLGADKVKAALRAFRGQGRYIDEVLS